MKNSREKAKKKITDAIKEVKNEAEGIKNSPGAKKIDAKLKKTGKKSNGRLIVVTIGALVVFPIAIISCRSKFNHNLFNADFQTSSSKSARETEDGEGILSASRDETFSEQPLTSSTITMIADDPIKKPTLTVTYLHTKNGNCTFAKSGDDTMLIDTGMQEDYDYIMAYLASENISVLDYLVLTGPSEDVCGNADDIINQLSVKTLITLKYTDARSDLYKLALKAARQKRTNLSFASRGEQYAFGESTLSVLAPEDNINRSEDETMIFSLGTNEKSFLFAGNASSDEFVTALSWANQQGYDLKTDVLYSSDHGSDSGYSEKFYAEANPKYVVIDQSADEKQISTDMITNVQNAGGTIYRMDKLPDSQNLICKTDGAKIEIVNWRK